MDRSVIGAAAPNESAFLPKMMTLMRDARALSQKALAEKSGLSQGAISKFENGSMAPTPDALAAIARALNVPTSIFGAPIEQVNLPLPFYRKRKSLPIMALRRIEATTNLRRMELGTLLRSAETPPIRVPQYDEGEPVSPRQVALDLRTAWHVPRGPVENVTALLENNGVIVVVCDFGSTKIDGLSITDPKSSVRPIILVSDTISGERLRFTLSHELGHVILHNDHLKVPEKDTIEGEADDFASEFLMPTSDIKGYFGRVTIDNLVSLKTHWRVSIAALIVRAAQLGRVTERQKKYMFMQLNARGHRLEEPNPIPREEPTLVDEIVKMHRSDLGYSDEELASALHLTLDEFRTLYGGSNASPQGLRIVR